MIAIVCEKPDVGNKVAAALDKITLESGKTVCFDDLKADEKAVKSQQAKDGYLKIRWQNQETYVTWGYGHLCELKQATDYNENWKSWSNIPLPLIPQKYELKVKKSAAAQFNKVKNIINKADLVINATDFDREGEVIFAYIYQLSGCHKPVKRAVFSSQTKEGLISGFTKDLIDGSKMKNTELAGRMRGIADWVVGANLSVAMTLRNPGRGVLSVGRVQTPTLKMIVDRDMAIKNFKPEPFYVLEGLFTKASGEQFKAHHQTARFNSIDAAKEVLIKIVGSNGIVKDIQKKAGKRSVPSLYSLSALQMDANSKYKYSLADTLEICQKLYDQGYTTYPRTDSRYLTEDMEPTVNAVLDKISAVPKYNALIKGKSRSFDRKKYFDNSKVESHFAIIPTGTIPDNLPEEQMNVYDLICRSVIRMLYHDAIIEQTKVMIDVSGEPFVASGSVIKDPGWIAVEPAKEVKQEEKKGKEDKDNLLPALLIGETLFGTYDIKESQTEPPKHYTDKTLLAAMLTAGKDLDNDALKAIMSDPKVGGIGTEATRANIVETLEKRDYITRSGKDKSNIEETQKGIDLIDMLPLEQVKSPELTAMWEQRLGNIARGEENASAFYKDFEKTLRSWMKEISEKVDLSAAPEPASYGICPLCKKPVRKTKFGYGCSGYKDGCKFSIGQIAGKSLTEKQVETLLSGKQTAKIKGFKKKDGSVFDAALSLDSEGKIKFIFENKSSGNAKSGSNRTGSWGSKKTTKWGKK